MIRIKNRMTERVTRSRLEVELLRSLRPLAVLAVGALVGIGAWAYIIGHVTQGFFDKKREVRFQVADATAVVAGRHDVKIKGVPAGTITKVDYEGGRAVLTAEVRDEFGPIYRDAKAQLRPNNALQDMALNIVDRGTPSAGEAKADDPLPAAQTTSSVNVAEVLQVFEPATARRLQTMLGELGTGLDDNGAQLRQIFAELVPFVREGQRLTQVVAQRDTKVRRLVRNFGMLTEELGSRETELRRFVRDGSTTLSTLGGSAPDIDATLARLPTTLSRVYSSFANLDGILDDVDGAVRELTPVAAELPSSLQDVKAVSADLKPTAEKLREPVKRLQPLAVALRPAARDLAGAAAALRPQVGAIDHATKSVAGCTLPIYGFFQFTASVTKFEDERGLFPRGDAVVSVNSLSDAQGGQAKDPNLFPSAGCAPGVTKTNQP